jgi:hypothetical protein
LQAAAPLAAAVAKPGAEVTLAGRKVQLNATTLGTILADHFVGGARILPNAVKDGEKLPTLAKGHSVIVKKVGGREGVVGDASDNARAGMWMWGSAFCGMCAQAECAREHASQTRQRAKQCVSACLAQRHEC